MAYNKHIKFAPYGRRSPVAGRRSLVPRTVYVKRYSLMEVK